MDGIIESIGTGFRNLMKGITSIFASGAHEVKEGADQLRDVDEVLDSAKEAADLAATQTLNQVNIIITNHRKLNNQAEMEEQQIAEWNKNIKSAAERAKTMPEGSAERVKLEALVLDGIKQKALAEDKLKPLQAAIAESQEAYDEALEMVHKAGLSKQDAESQISILKIEGASAQAKKALATASTSGATEHLGRLFAEAKDKVAQMRASAEAGEIISDQMPKTPGQVAQELSSVTRDQRVQDEFAELMGTSTQTTQPAGA
jgi:phage shock protein A